MAKDLLNKDVDSDILEKDDSTDLPDPLPWDDMQDTVKYTASRCEDTHNG